MGYFNSVTAQFRPSPGPLEGSDITPVPQPQTQDEKEKRDANIDVDVELQKSDAVYRPNVDPGVASVEAIQAVWGKKGKYIIIAGLAMVMIM